MLNLWKTLGLTAVIFSGATAFAAPVIDPLIGELTGKYQIQTGCTIDQLNDGDKLIIQTAEDTFHKVPMLSLVSYSPENRGDLNFALGKGTNTATSSGGTEYWETTTTADTLTAVLTYERRGASSWPDLGYRTTYVLTLKGDVLNMTYDMKSLWGHAKDNSGTCVAKSLKNVADEVSAVIVPSTSPEFAKLEPVLGNDADFDQATVQFERLKVNIKDPSKAQLQEVVGSMLLPQNTDYTDIKVTAFTKASKGTTFANKAMNTVLGIAKDFIKDAEANEKLKVEESYAPLFKYVDALGTYLDTKPSNVKVYLLEWSASDSDGSALIIINTDTGEAIYVGAYYFS